MELDQSEDQMSEWNFLVSMIIAAQRMGTERNVAWRDDCSNYRVETGAVGIKNLNIWLMETPQWLLKH